MDSDAPLDASTLDAARALKVAPKPGAFGRNFGDYELVEEIARGGMGIVYKARQIKLNRMVALKMILAGQLASHEDVQRFYTEAEAAAGLDHPGIVPIFEVGEYEGQHYFSMGFVDGVSLAAELADKPLAPHEAAEVLLRVAQAVQYAHDQGVIHRDLKPANILLKRNREPNSKIVSNTESLDVLSGPQFSTLQSQPVVTDFGLAKKTTGDGNLTGTGQILGTPSYMPPEQAAGRLEEIRETADVYSLGAILYATLTGRPPFQAAKVLETLRQVLDQEPVSPRALNPQVPQDLETICLKCLNKERGKRYQSAQELVDELQRFLNGEPIHARPIRRLERAAKWARRHPTVTALSGAVAASILIGFLAVTWQWRAAVAARIEADAARGMADSARAAAVWERDRILATLQETQDKLARLEQGQKKVESGERKVESQEKVESGERRVESQKKVESR